MTKLIAQVVEGFGEVESVPQILQRRLSSTGAVGGQSGEPIWLTFSPINARGRGNLIAGSGIEENVRIASRIPGVYSILVVLDAEDDAVCSLGPDLFTRAQTAAGPLPVRVCLAARQFENWLAACEVHGTHWDPPPEDYEGRGAESSIRARLPNGRYKKTTHQAQLTGGMDDALAASRCPSFARLLRCIDELIALG
jgi:hypothetical protein